MFAFIKKYFGQLVLLALVSVTWTYLLLNHGDTNFLSFLPALDAQYPCLFRLGMC